MIGSGSEPYFDGSSFARDGIVCVTINYRLGIAGYLHVEGEAAGNYGTLDQIAALRWVRENIASFGGDPDQVTIAGESAGGMAVGILLAAPAAQGLFRRAIAQSGASDHGLSLDSSRRVAREFCRRAEIAPDDTNALRDLSSARIIEVQRALFHDVIQTRDEGRYGREVVVTGMPFQPAIGGDILERRSIDIVAAGGASDIDLLVGHTREEFRLLLGVDPAPISMADVEHAYERAFPGRGSAVLRVYSEGRPAASPLELMAALETDRMFRIPAVRLADAQSGHNPRTYFYRLSWQSPAFDGRIGAGHAIDVPLVWKALDDELSRQLLGPNPPVRIADEMHSAWVAFTATGNPGHPGLPAWPGYTRNAPAVMDFGEPTQLLHAPDAHEVGLWDTVPASSSQHEC